MEDAIELGLEGLDHSVKHGFDKLPKSIREGHLSSPKLPQFVRRRSQSQSQSQSRDYDNYYNDDDRRSPSSPSSSRQRSSNGRERGEYGYQPSPSPRNTRREEGVTSPRSQRDLLSPRTATAATFDRDSRYGYRNRPRSSSAYNDYYEVSIYPILSTLLHHQQPIH